MPSDMPHFILSHERIICFGTCPRRYAFTYVLRRPPEVVSLALSLGKAVHDCIAHVERTGDPFEPDLSARLTALDASSASTFDLALSLMFMWHYWRRRRTEEDVRYVEHPFCLTTDAGIPFRGRIDRIAFHPGRSEWIVTDYKTGKSKTPRASVATNLQLGIYALALSKLIPDTTPIQGELVYLRDADTRAAQMVPGTLAWVEDRLDSAYRDILNARTYPARRGWWCKSCKYSAGCRTLAAIPPSHLDALKALAEAEDPTMRADAAAHLCTDRVAVADHALRYAARYDPDPRVRHTAASDRGVRS